MPAGLNSEFLSRDVLEILGFARLGEDVLIHSTVVIVDCRKLSLGSRIRIDPYVIISNRGGVEFGNNIHIGIYTSNEDLSGRTLSHPTVPGGDKTARTASISFGRHSAVGAGSLVFPGARFAEGSVLGAMSRVSRPLKPWTNYAGIPARRMRERHRDILEHERQYLASLKKLA
jgi:acetyltransferase-like isoleucine patch superfamily enzyme